MDRRDLTAKLLKNPFTFEQLYMFQDGKIVRKEHYSNQPSFLGLFMKQKLMPFWNKPSIQALKVNADQEQSKESKYSNKSDAYIYKDHLKPENFSLIDVGQMDYKQKKLVVIYNPTAGKRTNHKQKISDALKGKGIDFEIRETKGYLHALNLVKELNIDDYSAIVSVGGDGTHHEVVNGLLRRHDKKKIPICFLSGGTGNDLCGALGLDNINGMSQSIKYLLKGQTIKIDVFRALLDFESEEKINLEAKQNPKFDINNHLRYSVINTSLLLIGSSARNAGPYKQYLGSTAYTISTVVELIKREIGIYDINIDKEKHIMTNHKTMFMCIYNGKFGGGRIMINPLGIINDGLMDLCFYDGIVGVGQALTLFDGSNKGGLHIYDNKLNIQRCKEVKLTNKTGKNNIQDINIDGEDLQFKNFCKLEVLPSEIEVIVDFDFILQETYFNHHQKAKL